MRCASGRSVNRCDEGVNVFRMQPALVVPLTACSHGGHPERKTREASGSMTNCPACGHDVRTPFFLDLSKWSDLNCPQCKARLEMKPPRSVVLGPLMAPLFVLRSEERRVGKEC